jgi:hypothetical protein
MSHAPEQDHNHNLDSVASNYPCPVRRPRIVIDKRAKRREKGIDERSYFYLCCLCRSQHMRGQQIESGPPRGTRGSPSMFFCVDGVRSRIFSSATQGVRCRRFLCWWWVLPHLWHCLPQGPPSTIFRWWWALLDLPHRLPRFWAKI